MDKKKNTSGIHLWLVLSKAFNALGAHAQKHIAELGLGLSDFAVLEALLHKGPLTIKELGEKVLLTSGSMTAAIDRLENRGLVERADDAADRRVKVINLTSEGNLLIQKGFNDHRLVMEEAASDLAEHDRAVLIDLLGQLGKSAEQRMKNSAAKSGRKSSTEE